MASALEGLYRAERGRIVATLLRMSRKFADAEEVAQEAFAAAAERWSVEGLPANPGAWVMAVAKNRMVDRLRIEARRRELLEARGPRELIVDLTDEGELPDDVLRLIFLCCHPVLSAEAQIALTLRSLGGLETGEIARAFLVPEATMAQRLVRAKRKIADAGVPYRLPLREDLPERVESVLRVIYLIFNEGYVAREGDDLLRVDLCAEAIRLARLMNDWLPGVAEAEGLLALMLLTHSLREARIDERGGLVTLDCQDRARWQRGEIAEGVTLTERALGRRDLGLYQVQASIAALHCEAPTAAETDWPQIARLYDELMRFDSSPVARLNRAVAIGYALDWSAGLAELEAVEGLEHYHPYHAARAQMLRQLGRRPEALGAFDRAIRLTANRSEQKYLSRRMMAAANE